MPGSSLKVNQRVETTMTPIQLLFGVAFAVIVLLLYNHIVRAQKK